MHEPFTAKKIIHVTFSQDKSLQQQVGITLRTNLKMGPLVATLLLESMNINGRPHPCGMNEIHEQLSKGSVGMNMALGPFKLPSRLAQGIAKVVISGTGRSKALPHSVQQYRIGTAVATFFFKTRDAHSARTSWKRETFARSCRASIRYRPIRKRACPPSCPRP